MEKEIRNRKWLILFTCVLFTFMATLDGSIVNVALPVMSKAMDISSSDIQLVVTIYLIAISALILPFGRLGDMFGKTNIYKFGTGLFTISSLLCGIAGSYHMLILFRILQAIGASATMAVNQGIVSEAFPPNERGKAMGFLSTFVALGTLVGPPAGGFLVDLFNWNSIFLINVPVGILAIALSLKTLPREKHLKSEGSFDIAGAGLFMVFIVSFFISLDRITDAGGITSAIFVGFVIAIASLLLFIFWEIRHQSPLLKLVLFKNQVFTIQIIGGFISFAVMYAVNIVLPFYLQDAKGLSASLSGLVLMTSPLLLMFIAPVSGMVSDRIGAKSLTTIGLFIIGIGMLFFASMNLKTGMAVVVLFIGIMAVGSGIFQAPNTALIMSTVDRPQLGVAGSINALTRNVGMVFGIAVSTIILYGEMSRKAGYKVTDYIQGQDSIFTYGMSRVFIVAGIACFAGAALTLFMKKPTNR